MKRLRVLCLYVMASGLAIAQGMEQPPAEIPEPSLLTLVLLGLGAVAGVQYFRKGRR